MMSQKDRAVVNGKRRIYGCVNNKFYDGIEENE